MDGKFWTYLLPGMYFSALGLWYMFSVACGIASVWKSNGVFKSHTWYPWFRFNVISIEPWTTLIVCSLCAILELLIDKEPEHLGMYISISILSIIQLQQYYRSRLPSPYEFLVAAAAFIVIGLEIHYHENETPIVEYNLKLQIMYISVLVTLASLLEFIIRDHAFIAMIRASMFFLFGLNFFHTAFILYPFPGLELMNMDSTRDVTKVFVIFIAEMISLALPASVIMIGIVVDFFDNYV